MRLVFSGPIVAATKTLISVHLQCTQHKCLFDDSIDSLVLNTIAKGSEFKNRLPSLDIYI